MEVINLAKQFIGKAVAGKATKRYVAFPIDNEGGIVGSIYVPRSEADGIEALTVTVTPIKA